MWLLGSTEGERKRSDFIINWRSWEILSPHFPGWGRRENTGKRQTDRDRAILKLQVQEKVEGGWLRGWGLREFYSILAGSGTCHTGQLERWLIS